MALPSDQPELRTGGILQREFKLIHGETQWNRLDLPTATKQLLLNRAWEELQSQSADSEERRRAEADAMLLAIHAWSVHGLPDPGQSALCLSGGGIRSAAFALGILQGLARRDVLKDFHYLSTVSGGGYIGGWFAAWRKRFGLNVVLRWLGSRDTGWFAEARPLQRLRFNQNFLTPRVGIASADTWAAVAIVIRNLMLNWLVYLPLIAALLLVPRILEAFLRWMQEGESHSSLSAWFSALIMHFGGATPKVLPAGLKRWDYLDLVAVVAIMAGFGFSAYHRPARKLPGITQGQFMGFVVFPVTVGAVLLTGATASWLNDLGGPSWHLWRWVAFGPVVYVVASLGAALLSAIVGPRAAAAPAVIVPGGPPDASQGDAAAAPTVIVPGGPPDASQGDAAAAGVATVSSPVRPALRRLWAALWSLLAHPIVSSRAVWGKVREPVWDIAGWAVAGAFAGLMVGIGAKLAQVTLLSDPTAGAVAACGDQLPAGWRIMPQGNLHPILLACAERNVAAWLAVCGPPWILAALFLGETVYAGVTSRLSSAERDREWLARGGGSFGAVAIAYLVFCWLVVFGWPAILSQVHTLRYLVAGSGLLSVLGALLPLTRATAASAATETFPITKITAFLSGIFVLTASAALAMVTLQGLGWLGQLLSEHDPAHLLTVIDGRHPQWMFSPTTELLFLAIAAGLLITFSVGMSWFVNVNWFSLHALYRNRLVKTFLGATNVDGDQQRNRFDGYSDNDNLSLNALRATILNEKRAGEPVRLYPVINMTLNVVATTNLAWQQRKAEPFIATPWFTGGDHVGYRPSKEYGSNNKGFSDGLTLGTAMAISGAAASPNWGYHSSPITSLLMMLANVRLGWWMGNPRQLEVWRWRKFAARSERLAFLKVRRPWRKVAPRASWLVFLKEALGLTDDSAPWIYLSDGGHFENLGLYEMVRRRCRRIVVSDAGADPGCTLEDLGNAVRKIAIDLRVPIEFRQILLRKRSPVASAGAYFAIGDILYPEGRPGKILYIKPGFYGTQEPADVRAYAAANAKFPHESTLNQWFGESQFESYRSLGAFVIKEICGAGDTRLSLQELFDRAEDRLREFSDKQPNDGSTLVEIRQPIALKPEAAPSLAHAPPGRQARWP